MYSRRVLLYSGNRTSGTKQSYTIVLPFMLNKVRRIEWNSASIAGYLVCLQDFNENMTSGGTLYWRFFDTLSNQRVMDGISISSEFRRSSQSINTFVISLLNPDGTAATIADEHTIELEVFCEE